RGRAVWSPCREGYNDRFASVLRPRVPMANPDSPRRFFMNTPKKRILIVGGVAGGATCAARARRLCETCDILVFERGPHVSFANCGLPYFVGDVIASEAMLLVTSTEDFRYRYIFLV